MKLFTHYVFNIGMLSILLSPWYSPYIDLTVAGFLSVLGNSLIDRLGHEVRGGYIRRTPLTHTFPRSVFWGAIPALTLPVLSSFLLPTFITSSLSSLEPIILVSLLNGPMHMFLDMFTERGVYVKKRGRWRRFALAHFTYNNPLVNSLPVLAGISAVYFLLSRVG